LFAEEKADWGGRPKNKAEKRKGVEIWGRSGNSEAEKTKPLGECYRKGGEKHGKVRERMPEEGNNREERRPKKGQVADRAWSARRGNEKPKNRSRKIQGKQNRTKKRDKGGNRVKGTSQKEKTNLPQKCFA